MAGERRVVGECKLHPAHDRVQALGLEATVFLVHEVGVVDYLSDLREEGVVQLVDQFRLALTEADTEVSFSLPAHRRLNL